MDLSREPEEVTDGASEAEALGGLTQQLLDSAPDAVVIIGSDGLIRFVNAQTQRIFGYRGSELLGQPVEILVPDRVRDVHPALRGSYFTHPTTRPMGAGLELTARKKDGAEFPVDISLSSLETEEGLIVSAAIRDISDRIRAAEEKKELEAQLRQSRMESIGQLAGGIAHDFNNILAGIMVYARLVEDELRELSTSGPPPEDTIASLVADVGEIARATERASALTHQLLLFSRKEVMKREIIDLNSVVTEMDNLLRRTIGEHISLTVKPNNSISSINMDRGYVEQILMNLVVNARDAMPSGGQLIVETSEADLDEEYSNSNEDAFPGHYVCLAVSDTGVGMTSDVAAKAFEPFFTTKPRGEGSGLGLATIYGIVTQVRGHINIYSEVGVGTTIKVYLPAVDAAPAAHPRSEEETAPMAKGETILLVEDEDVVREPAARVLKKQGYNVLSANGPAEALALSSGREGEIDLLLSDVVMPGSSGPELAEKLKSFRPDLRVIFMSGYSHDLIASRGSVAEDIVLIEKPFTIEGLLRKVREVLDEPAGR